MAKKKTERIELTDNEDSLFNKALELISKEHGDKVIKTLSQMRTETLSGYSTGSLWLDWAINAEAGGILKGHVTEFYGQYSTGKTTLALGVCANVTANKKHVIYFDAEHSLQTANAVNAGVDEKYFTRIRERDGRQAAAMMEQLIKTGEVGLVVVDSVPAWQPLLDPKKGQDEVDFTKPKMAFHASFVSAALPHLAALCCAHDTALLLLNQERKNLTGYGSPTSAYGAEVIKHVDSVRVRCTGRVASTSSRINDTDGNIVGQYTEIVVDKNKTAVPMRQASLPLFLGRGVNPYLELAVISQEIGIVDGAAGRFKWKESGEAIAYGINAFTQKLYEDVDLYRILRDKVIEKLGIKYAHGSKVVNSFHDENFCQRQLISSNDTEE